MSEDSLTYLKDKLDPEQYAKLVDLGNDGVIEFVAKTIELCKPDSVFVATDSEADSQHVKSMAIKDGEEFALKILGHTCHFDGIKDQGRDKENTRFLLPPGVSLGESINSKDRAEGLEEVLGILEGLMKGKTMIVRFFCLGPKNSVFTQLCCQITDSFYVAHSEELLYRTAYDEFKRLGSKGEFFRFLHSAGRLDKGVCADIDKRRVYIDLEENTVYSVNTQYGGNSMGLKKLAMRLGIQKAMREGWLTEHMFAVGVHGPAGRETYMTGAFPSMCGKTSTAMIQGQSIVGDDIVYLRKIDGQLRAVNVEAGIFGIIQDVNPEDDPAIYKALVNPGEAIFSNVLIVDGEPYWLGMGSDLPEAGLNFSGEWTRGKTDDKGNEIDPSHKNARYTLSLSSLDNTDEALDDPSGIPVKALIYGGRDSDTSVPVEESFSWVHGVITKGASLESESTAATIGAVGVRTFNPMSNLEFLSTTLGNYIDKYLEFPEGLAETPQIFAVNYFLMKDGKYLNGMLDKKVWMLWIEKRAHGEVEALQSPTGNMPLYEDLRDLFSSALGQDYTEEQYVEQFTVRIPEQLAKLERIEAAYRKEQGIPEILFATLDEQRKRLEKMRSELGDYVSPLKLTKA